MCRRIATVGDGDDAIAVQFQFHPVHLGNIGAGNQENLGALLVRVHNGVDHFSIVITSSEMALRAAYKSVKSTLYHAAEMAIGDPDRDPRFAGLIALLGVIAGVLLWALPFVVSRSNIAGNGLALSGNGALVIPFGVGPAVVAGGWAAIILRMRGHPRWPQCGIGSGLVGLALTAGSLLSLIAFGPAGRDAGATASLFFGFLLYGWLLASAIVAATIRAPDPARQGPPLWSITAILLLPVTLIAGCEAGAGLLPSYPGPFPHGASCATVGLSGQPVLSLLGGLNCGARDSEGRGCPCSVRRLIVDP